MKDKNGYDPDHPYDALVCGEPMGLVATVIFLTIMFIAPVCVTVYFHYHDKPNAYVQGTRK